MKRELSALQTILLTMIVCIIFVIGVVYGTKAILGPSITEIKQENDSLAVQYDTLRAYIANKDQYVNESEEKLQNCNKLIEKYNKNITSIQNLLDLDSYLKDNDIDLESPAASFSDSELYTSDAVPDGSLTVEDTTYNIYAADFSFSYVTTYEKLKDFIDRFGEYNYALQNLSLSYDDVEQEVTGQISLKQFAILDASLTKKDIEDNNEKIEDEKTGVDNIFDVPKQSKVKKADKASK